MAIPASRAASRSVWPSRALTSLSSIVRVFTPMGSPPLHRGGCVRLAVFEERQEFVAEVAQGALDGVRRRLAEAAEARVLDHVAERLEPGEVVARRLPVADPG